MLGAVAFLGVVLLYQGHITGVCGGVQFLLAFKIQEFCAVVTGIRLLFGVLGCRLRRAVVLSAHFSTSNEAAHAVLLQNKTKRLWSQKSV